MDDPKRARSWKRLIRPSIALPNVAPVLYSTRPGLRPPGLSPIAAQPLFRFPLDC